MPDRNFGSFGGWVNKYARILRAAGYIVAILLLIIPAQRSFGYLLVVLLGLGIWALLVEFFGGHGMSQTKTPMVEGGSSTNNESVA